MKRIWLSLAFAAALLAGCTAQGADGGNGGSAGHSSDFAAKHYTTPLADVCPATVVLQTNWWPQPDVGWAYQLIGPGGKIDQNRFRYSGPLGSTGVNLEIRSGGPATGWTLPPQQLFLDKDILLGVTTTEDSVSGAVERPITSVFTYNAKSPLAFIWGTDDWHFKNVSDIRDSRQKVNVFDGAPFVDYLVGNGALDSSQIDGSFDGSLTRFISENGRLISQGFVTSEVYKLQHEIKQWSGKPVNYLLVGDEYQSYNSQVSVRTDALESNSACLQKLVPLLQQATVDYAKSPDETNNTLVDVVAGFGNAGSELTAAEAAWATKTAVAQGIFGNSPDGALGSFDLDRVDTFIKKYRPILEKQGRTTKPGITANDIVTNRFIDPKVGL